MTSREAPEEIRWDRMINNLLSAGLSYFEIGQATGFTSTQIKQMKEGSYEPPYLPMIKLLDLHLTACPQRHLSIGIRSPEDIE